MKLKNILILLLLFILISTFCGCTENKPQDSGKPVITVSIVPQITFVKAVCKDKLEVKAIIKSGASPETYEPSPKEIADLETAKIYFSIGVPAEDNILKNLSEKTKISKLHTVAAKEYPEIYDEGGRDPHIWLSPKRVTVMIEEICKTLSDFDTENKSFYETNAKAYINELLTLDKEITDILKDKSEREFIAFHPAFGYIAQDYSLTMYSLEEHGKEATAKHITEMTDLAKEKGIKTIFYQAETSGRQAKAFAEEIGGKAVALEPLSADYIENLKKMAQLISEAIS